MKQTDYKNYLLGVLLVIYAFNSAERLALGMVLQNIKLEFHLNDTQLGLLSGIAFALFYSLMGIPIARWADRGNRVTIISVTTLLWGIAVAACGVAANFAQLLLIRVGVAVGEAGCLPPANSLLADYFNRAARPRAVAIFMLGSPLSMVIGYFVAGWLNQLYGWRMTFILLGLPALALSALVWLTLREPRRLPASSVADGLLAGERPASFEPRQSFRDVWVALWTNITFRRLWFCFSVTYFFSYGLYQWQPTFFMRSYGLASTEVGSWFALIYGLGGLAGTYLGGALASRYAANNEALQLRFTAVVFAAFGAVMAGVYLSPNKYIALALTAGAAVGGHMTTGPLFGVIQTVVPERMRAMSIALIYLFANLVGLGLGPFAVGTLSDLFHPWAGAESLRYALLCLCPGFLWGSYYLWLGSRTVIRDVEAVEYG